MIVKKVNRYYCEFCKKSKGTKSSMASHERHCTMNPNRECRMCIKLEGGSIASIQELIALLPISTQKQPIFVDGVFSAESEAFDKLVKEAVLEIRKATTCPVCILSALRQSGIDQVFWSEFNYKEEMAKLWRDYNQNKENGYY